MSKERFHKAMKVSLAGASSDTISSRKNIKIHGVKDTRQIIPDRDHIQAFLKGSNKLDLCQLSQSQRDIERWCGAVIGIRSFVKSTDTKKSTHESCFMYDKSKVEKNVDLLIIKGNYLECELQNYSVKDNLLTVICDVLFTSV